MAHVARENGINEGTLSNWVNKHRKEHAGDEPELELGERARLREAERELREVKMENEFLRKAAAYFAQIPGLLGAPSSSGVSRIRKGVVMM